MNNQINFGINFNLNGDNKVQAVFQGIQNNMDTLETEIKSVNQTLNTFSDNTTKAIEGASSSIKKGMFSSVFNFNALLDVVDRTSSALSGLANPGISLDQSLHELSAITGVTGQGLKEIEQAARDTSKAFGTNATSNVEAYKLVLSQLDPEIAKNSTAMKLMGENINILSKQMGGDTVKATEVLTTSMNQFGISTENPIEAAQTMADMMNTMSAAAQAGSAELPQIKTALEQVGMVAKTAGLSFEQTNAQIQILDKAGKKGSEGGVALRNVLTTLSEGRFTSKLAADGLTQAGISVEYLADTSVPLTDRLRSLRAIQNDTALMTKVFGKENMAAAIALINGADEAENLTQQITGTNSAMEQAEIIMESATEKNARIRASVDDFKISLYNSSKGVLGYAEVLGDVARDVTNLSPLVLMAGKSMRF